MHSGYGMTLIIRWILDGIRRRGFVAWVVSGSGGESGAMAEWTGAVAQDELRVYEGESTITMTMVLIGPGSSGDGYIRDILIIWM